MMIQTLTWQGAHVVAELGIAAPRTKSDDDGRFTDPATLAALRAVATAVLAAPGQEPDDRVAAVEAAARALRDRRGAHRPLRGCQLPRAPLEFISQRRGVEQSGSSSGS